MDEALAKHLANHQWGFGMPGPLDAAALLYRIPGWNGSHLQPVAPDIIGATLLFEALSDDPGRASDWLWAILSYCAKDEALTGRLSTKEKRTLRMFWGSQPMQSKRRERRLEFDGYPIRVNGW
jgi:hypothetical protein